MQRTIASIVLFSIASLELLGAESSSSSSKRKDCWDLLIINNYNFADKEDALKKIVRQLNQQSLLPDRRIIEGDSLRIHATINCTKYHIWMVNSSKARSSLSTDSVFKNRVRVEDEPIVTSGRCVEYFVTNDATVTAGSSFANNDSEGWFVRLAGLDTCKELERYKRKKTQ